MKLTQKRIRELAEALEDGLDGVESPGARHLYGLITSFVAEALEFESSKIRYSEYKEPK